MTDGTETPETDPASQPIVDEAGTVVGDVEGAPEPTEVDPAIASDKPLQKALASLPDEVRESLSGLPAEKLAQLRPFLLRGSDYHQKRQKESEELRTAKRVADEAKQKAIWWDAAVSDPERAVRLFQANIGEGNGADPTPQPVDPLELFNETDPEAFRRKWDAHERSREAALLEKVRREMGNQPVLKERALETRLSALRSDLGVSQEVWNGALQSVDTHLRGRGVNYLDVSPDSLAFLVELAIDRKSADPAAESPVTTSPPTGAQAASVLGSGASSKTKVTPAWEREKREPTFAERLAVTLRQSGFKDIDALRRNYQYP
jgi:hypothetical protein